MVEPTIDKLLTKADSKYSLVCAAAKRAREISERAQENDEIITEKTVSLAIEDFKNEECRLSVPDAE